MILYVSIIPQYLTFDWCLDKYLSVYAPFFVALAHAIILKIYSFTKMKKSDHFTVHALVADSRQWANHQDSPVLVSYLFLHQSR